MSDFMNRDTNRLFTEIEWRAMIDEIHFKKTNQHLHNLDLLNLADKVMKIQKQIPRLARRELQREHNINLFPGDKVYIIRRRAWEAEVINSTQAQRVWIDNVGKGHLRPKIVNMRNYTLVGVLALVLEQTTNTS